MSVSLVSITPHAEELIAYIARVSSPNQDNPQIVKLLKYCLDHGHWSIFEHAFATLEIRTSRAISAQITRHRSFSFSEFSQRYANVVEQAELLTGRRQATKNRQSSTDDLDESTAAWFLCAQRDVQDKAHRLYEEAVKRGVAREQARFLLPLSTPTRLYMSGSVRSWLHYCQLRCQPDTQLEHRQIADGCKAILTKELPTIASAMGW